MKLTRLICTPFSLPYRRPFATAHGTEHVRRGVVVRLETDEGLTGLGEGSPLAMLHGGTAAQTLAILRDLAPRVHGLTVARATALLGSLDLHGPGMAAAACALETALCDLQSQTAGVPLAALLGTAVRRVVSVNATIGAATTEGAVAAACQARAAGFRCVKLKVGLAGHSAEAEIARVAEVRAVLGPGPRLRLDANGAWEAGQAIVILREVRRFDLELVEQPTPEADLEGMARVRAEAGVPIAADEAVSDLGGARRVIAAGAADILVVKPMCAGGPRAGAALLDLARAAGLDAIVTTTLDAGVGTAMALHLAATLPTSARACGLATASLLAADLLAHPHDVTAGTLALPPHPGLGVTLDEAQVARYAPGWREVAG